MTYIALVAEDEELIREIVVDALTDAGFVVLEAEHASEALKLLDAQGKAIHLLFTDVHMPGEMNGLALARHIRENWPSVAILIASGRPRPAAHEMPSGSRFIAKPYLPNAVVIHARELVGLS